MRRVPGFIAAVFAVGALVSPLGVGTAAAHRPAIARSPLTMSSAHGRHLAHLMPPPKARNTICPSTCADAGPLLYHSGRIMPTTTTFAIFWAPAHLQSGAASSMPSSYRTGLSNLLADIGGHGIYNIATEYSQSGGALSTAFIHNQSTLGGSYLDTHAYPASGCVSSDIPVSTNCINDVQLRAEIKRVMALKGWTSGINHLFLVFTEPGEGSCFTSASLLCSYIAYCGYHSFMGPKNNPIVYVNDPYDAASICQTPATPVPTGLTADAAAGQSIATHEIIEAITDPELDSWYTSLGNEIGDLCSYVYGTNTWNGGNANEMWNGRFYEVQEEWSNHNSACLQVGP